MLENLITLLKLVVEIAYLAMFIRIDDKKTPKIEKTIFRILNIVIGLYGYWSVINEIMTIKRFELSMLLTLVPATAMLVYGVSALIKQRKMA